MGAVAVHHGGIAGLARPPGAGAAAIPATASWREVASEFPATGGACAPLSPAERVVLACLRQGLSNREIAHALGKAEATVKNQVAACLQKCGVSTRARLMAKLLVEGASPG
jgi:DNA-binding NarL/FixJ family response regulator